MRIPRVVRLPFDYDVKVKQVTVREMREVMEDDDSTPDGCWVVDDQTIYLLKSLPAQRKRYILAHELVHAVNDMAHAQVNEATTV